MCQASWQWWLENSHPVIWYHLRDTCYFSLPRDHWDNYGYHFVECLLFTGTFYCLFYCLLFTKPYYFIWYSHLWVWYCTCFKDEETGLKRITFLGLPYWKQGRVAGETHYCNSCILMTEYYNYIKHLLYARHYSTCFISINPLNSHNSPVRFNGIYGSMKFLGQGWERILPFQVFRS